IEDAGFKTKPDAGSYLYGCALLGVDPAAAIGIEDTASGYRSLQDAGVGIKIFCRNGPDMTHYNGSGRAGYADPDLTVDLDDDIAKKLYDFLTAQSAPVQAAHVVSAPPLGFPTLSPQ